MAFGPVTLSHPRCRLAWAVNDGDLLREIAVRHPEVLPPAEWATVAAHLDFLASDESYRRQFADAPPCRVDEAYLTEEWRKATTGYRWQYVVEHLREALAPPARLLDLGTWTGAHAVALANAFPTATVYAREIVRAQLPAIVWTVQRYADNPEQVAIEIGDHLDPPLPRGLDAVFCGEVLEHVRDVEDFVRTLEYACKPGGTVVLTVPVETPDATERNHVHVRHLETADVLEMFGGKPNFRGILAEGAGHVVHWTVGETVGRINWARKVTRWLGGDERGET